jgi:prolipoprotein diacylglyceryltransferase
LRVNTNLLAGIGEGFMSLLIVASLFWYQIKHKKYAPGKIAAIFLAWYSLVRFILENFRADSQQEYVGMFTISQRFFLLFFMIALIWLQIIKEVREEK